VSHGTSRRPRRKLAVIAGVLGVAAIAAAAGVALTSGPSYPHPWCAPVIAQFHARETPTQYLVGLTALQNSGAPIGQLVTDEGTYQQDEAEESASGQEGFTAVFDAPGDVAAVSRDLQQVNRECGQPPDAYASDNA